MRLVKQPIFVFSAGYLLVLFTSSLLYKLVYQDEIPQTGFAYDGDVLVGPPFAPFHHSLFGTDHLGNHLAAIILAGAKYTIGATFVIAVLAGAAAMALGLGLGMQKRWQSSLKSFEHMLSAFYFVPASIIAYLLLQPILWQPYEGFYTSLAERIIWQLVIISLVLVPPAAILIANEVKTILKKEFVLSSMLLGADKLHLLKHHVLPHLRERIAQVFFQLLIQAFLILGHLGVFQLFFGGTKVSYDPFAPSPPAPITYEWFSYIGNSLASIQQGAAWLLLIPLFFVASAVAAFLGILYGYNQTFNSRMPKAVTAAAEEQERPHEATFKIHKQHIS